LCVFGITMYRLSMVRVDAIGFIDFGVTSHNVIDQSMIIRFLGV
jgi:hypothetical protein